ncbi:hypothetical protein ACLKA6_005669 [Drosophila palustris]
MLSTRGCLLCETKYSPLAREDEKSRSLMRKALVKGVALCLAVHVVSGGSLLALFSLPRRQLCWRGFLCCGDSSAGVVFSAAETALLAWFTLLRRQLCWLGFAKKYVPARAPSVTKLFQFTEKFVNHLGRLDRAAGASANRLPFTLENQLKLPLCEPKSGPGGR